MWLALLPGGGKKKETKANTLPWKCWKRKLPSIKKVTKFPHCINRFQYSKRWGWGRSGDYVQGPNEKKNAVVGLWHYKQFPPGLWEGRRELRSSRGLQARATEALVLRVAGEMAHSRWGGAFFSLQRQRPPFQCRSSDQGPCLSLASLCRGVVGVRVRPVCRAFGYSLTPAPPLL